MVSVPPPRSEYHTARVDLIVADPGGQGGLPNAECRMWHLVFYVSYLPPTSPKVLDPYHKAVKTHIDLHKFTVYLVW